MNRLDSPPGGGYHVTTTSDSEAKLRARIVRVGNSRGVRLPKALLEEAGLPEDVVLRAEPGRITIEAADHPRAGWAEAADEMAAAGEDALIDPPVATAFDEKEWTW